MSYDPGLVATLRGYNDLHWLLNNGVAKKNKLLENNTRVRFDNDKCDIVIALHENDIITLFANGDIKIDTCGWGTNTTINRINDYLPIGFSAHRKRGMLYINWPNGSDILEREVYFHKVIGEDGRVEYRPEFSHTRTNEPMLITALRDNVSEYARAYCDALEEGRLYGKEVKCEDCDRMQSYKRENVKVSPAHILEHIDLGQMPHQIIEKTGKMFKFSTQEMHMVDTMLDGRTVETTSISYGRKRYIRSAVLKYLLKQFNLPF